MKRVIIVDIDGCLSDHSHRINLAKERQWEDYHQLSQEDPPIEAVVDLVKALASNTSAEVIICTARPEKYAATTKDWLDRHSIPRIGQYMRKDGDARSSAEVKAEQLTSIRQLWEVWFAIDDQQSIKDMYARAGVICLQPPDLLAGIDHSKWEERNAVEEERCDDGMGGPEAEDGPWAEGWVERNGFSVPSILEAAAHTFAERNHTYKDTWKMHGKVMKQFWPDGITLKTEEDFLKYHLFVLEVIKMIRTANSGMTHVDSQHDNIVYSAMFESAIRGGVK